MKEVTCSICDKKVATKFCDNCGQKIGRKTTTMLSMILDLFSKVISFERSVPATIYSVLKTPKKVVNNYMEGHRNYYSNPGALLFWALTIGALHVFFVNEQILGGTFDFTVKDSDFKISAQAAALLISIIFLLISSLLTYIKSQKSFSLQIISIIYNTCTFFILLTFLFDLITLVFPLAENSGLGFLFLLLIVILWHARVLGSSEKKWLIILKFIIQLVILSGIIYGLVYLANSN